MSSTSRLVLVAAGLWCAACRHVPIVDGAQFGQVTQVKDFFTSVFVVQVGDDEVILIDAGYDEDADPILRALRARGLGPGSVSHIFLTHRHADHVGGMRHFVDAEVLALAAEVDGLETNVGVEVDRAVEDGERVEVAGTTVEVLAVPGHTEGSAAYLVDGVLILGDAAMLYRRGGAAPVAERRSSDPARALASLEALKARLRPRRDEIRAIAFSHSASTDDLAAFFD